MNDDGTGSGWRSLALWRKGIYVVGALVLGSVGAGIGGAIGLALGDAGSFVGGLIGWGLGTWLVFRGMRDDIDYVTSPEYAQRNPGSSGVTHWP